MRILFSLTYYRPHVSGLTIYVERLARRLTGRGHEVTVLTSRHDDALPVEEHLAGVHVVRVPVMGAIGKGPLMPGFAPAAIRLLRSHDIVSLHLPQAESALVAGPAKAMGIPVAVTYHCDIELPPGRRNAAISRGIHMANGVTGRLADAVVAYTDDYATHSPFLQSVRSKVVVIPPPVAMVPSDPGEAAAFRHTHQLGSGPLLGYASRFAAEKGIEHGIDAVQALLPDYPDLRVLFAGPYEGVIGEDDYRLRLETALHELGDHWTFLGTLSPAELPAFYGSLDMLLMTSVNSTESFGLVQVEAMLCGTPVVTVDMPGVRQPVLATGMGVVTEVANATSLASGIRTVLEDRARYIRPQSEIEATFSIDTTVAEYEDLFTRLLAARKKRGR